MTMTIGEKLDKATGLIVEAKEIFENPDVRADMIAKSYLGEMGEEGCLNVALIKIKEAVQIYEEFLPDKIDIPLKIFNSIEFRLAELTKPSEPELEPDVEDEPVIIPTVFGEP